MPHITISIKMDDDGDQEKYEAAKTAAMMAAKHMLTVCALIAGKRKPMVTLQIGDLFHGQEEIELADDIPGLDV